MTTLYYTRSNGVQVLIAEMPFPHLKSAAEKLRKSCPPHREEELAAMDARLAELEVEYRRQLETIIADPATSPEDRAKAAETLAKLSA